MKQNNFNSMMKTAKVVAVLFLSMLPLGAISMGLVACSNDESEESPEIIDKSPAQAIDLGLPSGTLWASCNVGATKPEEYGDYFAWGEIVGYKNGKTNFSWDTYKWCNKNEKKLTKYCINSSFGDNGFIDNKMELDFSDDAAYVHWGSNWRMPSYDQIKELVDNCIWEWTTLNGIIGYRVKSKKNGNSIFLPTTGYRQDTSLGGTAEFGRYWSRSICANSINEGYSSSAYILGFASDYVNNKNNGSLRFYGRSVRPVRRN